MEGSITLFAEKGTVKIGGQYLNTIEYQKLEGEELPNINISAKANDYGIYQGSMSNHDKVYENLIKAMQDEDHPFSNAYDGLKTVEVIERIYNSVSLS